MCACASSWVCDDAADTVEITHIHQLPVELLMKILSHLPLRQLFRVQRVSRHWRDTAAMVLATVQELDTRTLCRCYTSSAKRGFACLKDSDLEKAVKKMSGLKRFSACERDSCDHRWDVGGKMFRKIFNICPKLVEIDVSSATLDNDTVMHLCRNCIYLEVVKVRYPHDSENSCIEILLRCLPRLRHLDIGSNIEAKSDWFHLLPSRLEHLVFPSCRCLKSEDIGRIGEYCPNLANLNVTGFREEITLKDYISMLAGLPRLRTLAMTTLPPKSGSEFSSISDHLTSLTVEDSDEIRQITQWFPNLTSLKLKYISISEVEVLHLASLKQLSVLVLGIYQLTDAVLDVLQLLPLTELHLPMCGSRSMESVSKDALKRFIVGSHRLRVLQLDMIPVNKKALHEAAADISPSRRMEIRSREDDRLLFAGQKESDNALLLVVKVNALWYISIRHAAGAQPPPRRTKPSPRRRHNYDDYDDYERGDDY